ncbi:MAG TPA: DedA family protein [Gemmatimonadales bacterium]
MFDWVTGVVEEMGYIGIAMLTLLENIFPPIPSELIMPLAGFVAKRGGLAFWGTVAAGTAGSFAGAVVWYEVGRRIGERRLHAWLSRHGRWLGIGEDDFERAAGWFRRHGVMAVLIGRLVPGVRTFISVPAGFSEMPRASFALYTLAGTFAWTLALAYAGHLLGENYDRVHRFLEPVSWTVIALVVLLPIVRALRRRRAERERT